MQGALLVASAPIELFGQGALVLMGVDGEQEAIGVGGQGAAEAGKVRLAHGVHMPEGHARIALLEKAMVDGVDLDPPLAFPFQKSVVVQFRHGGRCQKPRVAERMPVPVVDIFGIPAHGNAVLGGGVQWIQLGKGVFQGLRRGKDLQRTRLMEGYERNVLTLSDPGVKKPKNH